jgi:hypothetical protein
VSRLKSQDREERIAAVKKQKASLVLFGNDPMEEELDYSEE